MSLARAPLRHFFSMAASSAYRKGARLVSMASLEPGTIDVDACIALVDTGADITVTDVTGDTALHWATYWGHDDLAEVLINKGYRDSTNNKMKTPLHHAAGRADNTTRILQCLIDSGAYVNAKDANGSTPLMEAACRGNKEKVDLLLQAGADPTERSHFHKASDFARQRGYQDIADILKKAEDDWTAKYDPAPENKTPEKNTPAIRETAPLPIIPKKSLTP